MRIVSATVNVGTKEIHRLYINDSEEEFGKGFSVRTLQQMKKFYVMFPNTNALRSQLTWAHYRLLLSVENE